MTNEYYMFTSPAVSFTTLDPRPYNREMKRIADGFDKVTPPEKLNTGTQYFGHCLPFVSPQPGVPYPNQFLLPFDAFPGNLNAGAFPPDGVRVFFTFPFSPRTDELNPDVTIFIVTEDMTTLWAAISLVDGSGNPYPDGTFFEGVIYEVAIQGTASSGLSAGKVLSGGATILGVVTKQTAQVAAYASAAGASDALAIQYRNAAQADLNEVISLRGQAQQRYQDYLNYQATETFRGLVVTANEFPPVVRPHPVVMSRTQAFQIYTRTNSVTAPGNHTHPASDITSSTGTTTRTGFVRVVNVLSSQSTADAISAAQMKVLSGIYAGKAEAIHTHNATDIVDSAGTTDRTGFVSLFNTAASSSTTVAATINALHSIYATLPNYAALEHRHNWGDIVNPPVAGTTVVGIVQTATGLANPSLSLALSAQNGPTIVTSLSGKANVAHTHNWADIVDPPQATTDQAGIVQTTASGNDQSTTLAATAGNMGLRYQDFQLKAVLVRDVDPAAPQYPVGCMIVAALGKSGNQSQPISVFRQDEVNLSEDIFLNPSSCAGTFSGAQKITTGRWRATNTTTSPAIPAAMPGAVSIWIKVG